MSKPGSDNGTGQLIPLDQGNPEDLRFCREVLGSEGEVRGWSLGS
jgi:hypothetical protein